MNANHAIWAESLTKTYRSGDARMSVFRELSVSVPRGEQLAVIGESGAGKSTLLHILGGLDQPDSGRIGFGDQVLGQMSRTAKARFQNRELGFVWQNPSLLPEFTARENVMMPLLIRGVTAEEAEGTAQELLRETGLEHRGSHRSGELSGGEQQRVALARALAGGPKYLLADEPTGSLDARTGDEIIDLLSGLHQAHGLTSIYVTHNLGFAHRCDRVLELRKGQLQSPAAIEMQLVSTAAERCVGSTGAAEHVGKIVMQDATRLDGGTYV